MICSSPLFQTDRAQQCSHDGTAWGWDVVSGYGRSRSARLGLSCLEDLQSSCRFIVIICWSCCSWKLWVLKCLNSVLLCGKEWFWVLKLWLNSFVEENVSCNWVFAGSMCILLLPTGAGWKLQNLTWEKCFKMMKQRLWFFITVAYCIGSWLGFVGKHWELFHVPPRQDSRS